MRALASAGCVAAACAVLALVGCTSPPGPGPTVPAAPTTAPAATPVPAPMLEPQGTAEENLPVFRDVVEVVAQTDRRHEGRAYIDALVAAGFPRGEMELTPDRTTVGDPADSIQFSVRWSGECLVGQVGPSTPEPVAVVLPLVPTGTCLIGQTRPIDW
jgi:hypothetical protein